MTKLDLDAIEALARAATPGPLAWRGYVDGSIELRTADRGGQRIVTTMRSEPCVVELADGSIALTAQACGSCLEEARKSEDPFVDYRCPKKENLDTIWLHDWGTHLIRPANDWAVREQPYRGDVARVEHPDARFIAEVSPDVVLALVDRIRDLEHSATGLKRSRHRPWTEPKRIDNGDGTFSTRLTVKRACNGCGNLLGDSSVEEIEASIEGLPLTDVRAECPTCSTHAQTDRNEER